VTDPQGTPSRSAGPAVRPALLGLAGLAGLALIAGAGRIVTPLAVHAAVDRGLLSGTADAAAVVGRVVLFGALATVLAGAASWLLNRVVVERIEAMLARLRVAGLDRVHRMPPEALAGQRSGDLVSRVTVDLEAVTTFLANGGILLAVNLAQMLLAGAVMLVYSWQLGSAVIVVALVLFAVMRWLQRVVAGRFAAVRGALAALQVAVDDVTSGIAVIRSTGSVRPMRARLDGAVEHARLAQRHVLGPLHTTTALGEVAIGLMTAIVVIAGVAWSLGPGAPGGRPWWHPDLRLTAGELVAMLLLVTFFVRPLQSLVQLLAEAQNALSGWRRARELATAPQDHDDTGTRVLPAGPIEVRTRDLWAAYRAGTPVLCEVTLDIAAGEHVALVGATGSGKSSLAKLLTRQLRAESGSVRLNGVPIERIEPRAFSRRVAIVPQDPFLFDATVRQNIARAGDGRVPELIESLGLGDWTASLPLGLDTPVGPRGNRLSAGERQLVALARTALVDPDLLILDEATSGVDPATDVRVHRALAALTRGRTTITIAHRLATAEAADRIVVLDAGRVVQVGTHAELMRRPGRYAQLHRAWLLAVPAAEPDTDETSSAATDPPQIRETHDEPCHRSGRHLGRPARTAPAQARVQLPHRLRDRSGGTGAA